MFRLPVSAYVGDRSRLKLCSCLVRLCNKGKVSFCLLESFSISCFHHLIVGSRHDKHFGEIVVAVHDGCNNVAKNQL